ncbi:hypothetical protein F5888DRAFT_1633172 [Russula emetica]|nr:hypothetical protein F5888DRAFT_1633172 [Russula emetica]
MCGALPAHFSGYASSAGLRILVRRRWRCVCIAPSHSCSLFGTATYHDRASIVTEWTKDLMRKRTSRREKEEKLAQHFPIWRRESENHRGHNRPTKMHTFLMNFRASVLGKHLLQNPKPKDEDPSYPPPRPPFTYTRMVLTRTLGTFPPTPDRDSDLPFLPLSSHACTHARTHACTHAHRGTGEDKLYCTGQIEGNLGNFYPLRPVSARYSSHSPPPSHPCFSRLDIAYRKEWSCSVIVYGIERIFWIAMSRRSFRPSGIPQARAKRIDDRTYYAIAEYDLGHQVCFETTAGDDVIPPFCFEKMFNLLTAKEEKNESTRYSLYPLALSGWTGRSWSRTVADSDVILSERGQARIRRSLRASRLQMWRSEAIVGKCCLPSLILPHETKKIVDIYLISGSHKPQVRLCNSITVMASEWFVEKKEGRSKGALSAREGGLLEDSIRDWVGIESTI